MFSVFYEHILRPFRYTPSVLVKMVELRKIIHERIPANKYLREFSERVTTNRLLHFVTEIVRRGSFFGSKRRQY